jgi:heme exporter protein C
MIIFYAPNERVMGVIQKILYLMVPFAWLALFSFVIIFVASILYLSKRTRRWDILAHSAAELGLLSTSITLAVGILWTRPEWGVWWAWEPRLTATLVLWFIYIAYLMVRSFATEESRGARFAAVVGIIGFVDVPIIGMSTTIWRTLHPPLLIFQEGGIAPEMLQTLIVSIIAFTSLYLILLKIRVSIRNQENELIELKKAVEQQ